ncbi:hypothetical protein M9Y10_021060 [Tritrichomonas musculus]|uniref:Uncharacterized protein n=1 Tax=Tritrichomonas musculus TaxID=1915356 RepID=A0ABR2HCW6_9EUKA
MNVVNIITKLSKKSTTRIESVRLLKSFKKELREKISNGSIKINDVKQIFQKILEETDLIYCPTFIVRLYLASCFSDALFVFAPNIPLSTTGELDAVFQLFSTVISSNCQEGSTEYTIIQSIIDVLIKTDSYLLISNREVSLEIIESMIQIKVVSIPNDRYDSNFQNAIKFTADLINASTSNLILPEVARLFSVNFNSCLIVQKILPLLSQNQQMSIVFSFQQYLNYNDFMIAFVKATKILKMSFGFIVQLLYQELLNEDDTQRMSAFTLIKELFDYNKQEISMLSNVLDEENDNSEDIKSVKFVLSRNVDKCPKIRLVIIQIAADLLASQNRIFFDNAMNVIKSVHCDPNEGVRFAGLDIIWKLQKAEITHNLKNDDKINSYGVLLDDNALYVFLNDKSNRIREKALVHLCEILQQEKVNGNINDQPSNTGCIDKIISYSFEKPGVEIFLAYSILFDSFDSTELYEMVEEKAKYMKILNFIQTTSEYVRKYVETGNLSNNNLTKLLTKEIWKPFVPNKDLLLTRGKYKTYEAIQAILKNTNEQFAKEFSVLTMKIPINTEKLICECENKKMIKDFAGLNPKIFISLLPQILERCDKECVTILPFISDFIFMDLESNNDKNDYKIIEIFDSLITASTQNSLIVLAKLLSKWNDCFWSKKKICSVTKKNKEIIFHFFGHHRELKINEFNDLFSLKFFFFLSIPEVVPKFAFNKSESKDDLKNAPIVSQSVDHKSKSFSNPPSFLSSDHNNISSDKYNDQYVKWSLRISTLFNDYDIIKIHFYFFKLYPLQCLESLLRISNVISSNYHFSILLPNKSTSYVFHQFKSAQKKGKNLLNIISVKEFRMIASLLLDTENDSLYVSTKTYTKMKEKFWILSMIDEALKNPKTPIEFLSLIVLGLVFKVKNKVDIAFRSNESIDINDLRNKIYEKARLSLVYHINLRRKFVNRDLSSQSSLIQTNTDSNNDESVNLNSSQNIKSRKSSKSALNSHETDEKFIKLSQNSLISGQQVELMIPSLFNILSFYYYDQTKPINFKSIIDDLFTFIIPNSQQKSNLSYVINDIRSRINHKSAFGKKMKLLCDYASSKIAQNVMMRSINSCINSKFVIDDRNDL